MKAVISCMECNAPLCEMEKAVISDQDIEDYGLMFSCNCGTEFTVSILVIP